MSSRGMGASPVRGYRRRGSACDDDNLMILTKLLRVSLIIDRHLIFDVHEFLMTFCIVDSER